MYKSNFFRLAVFSFCVVILTTIFTINTSAQLTPGVKSRDTNNTVETQISPVYLFGSTTVVPQAGASLSRNNEGVFGTISTSGIPAGHVVTFWWALFNFPQYCAASVCAPPDFNNRSVYGSLQYGGGYLVGVNGRADFSGYLGVGDNTGFFFLPPFPNMPNPAPGLFSSRGAEIHLVIRDHGTASSDPATLQQQLSTFGTGTNIQAAVFNR